jgi:hypothetical protein
MPLQLGIPFAFFIAVVAAVLTEALKVPALQVIVLIAGGVWVYFDAKKLDLERYRTALRYPELACFGTILMWIVVFPWYLAVRYRIKLGLQPLRHPAEEPRDGG